MSQIRYQLPRYRPLHEQDVQRVHDQSMRILGELGIAFYDAGARQILDRFSARMARASMATWSISVKT